jgi:hypothetical protein
MVSAMADMGCWCEAISQSEVIFFILQIASAVDF